MPFGIGSAAQIMKAVQSGLPQWNASHSTTDAKVQHVFAQMKWSENSWINILTFGLDSYFKKRTIRQILKEEISSFKVEILPQLFSQIESENPFEKFQIFNEQERALLVQVGKPSFEDNPSWHAVKEYLRGKVYKGLAADQFVTPLLKASTKELDALASFLNGKRPSFKNRALLDSGVKLASASRLYPELFPILPKRVRQFLRNIDSENSKLVESHLIKLIKANLHHRSASIQHWIDSCVPKLVEYATAHLGSDRKDDAYGQFLADLARQGKNNLQIASLGEKKKPTSLKGSKDVLIKRVTQKLDEIANALGETKEEKKLAALYLQICMSQGLFGTKSGEITQAIVALSQSNPEDAPDSPFFVTAPETTFEILHIEKKKVQFKITSRNKIECFHNRGSSTSSPLPIVEADFSIFLEKTPERLKVTTDL
jgi:hypothetical protein